MKLIQIDAGIFDSELSQESIISYLVPQIARKETIIVSNISIEMYRLLERTITVAIEKKNSYNKLFVEICRLRDKHINSFLAGNAKDPELCSGFTAIQEVLQSIDILNECTRATRDFIFGLGEIFYAKLLSLKLAEYQECYYIAPKDLLVSDENYGAAELSLDQSTELLLKFARTVKKGAAYVIPGNIAYTKSEKITTLGKGAAYQTLAILSTSLSVDSIEIYNSDESLFTADPRIVEQAKHIKQLTYDELMEMGHFNKAIPHTFAIGFLKKHDIPLEIKSINRPEISGTLVSSTGNKYLISNITSHAQSVSLFSVKGSVLMGKLGFASRLFAVLERAGVNILFIAQTSGEYSISLAINSNYADIAEQELLKYINTKYKMNEVDLSRYDEQRIIAVIGNGMAMQPGLSGHLFDILGHRNISIKAISQGAEETNISIVVAKENKDLAISSIHQSFFLDYLEFSIFIVGVGSIGSNLINIINSQYQRLISKGFKLSIHMLSNSRKICFPKERSSLADYKEALQNSSTKFNIQTILNSLRKCPNTNMVLIDCTASEELVRHYSEFAQAGASIISPNKKANVLELAKYKALHQDFRNYKKYFLYETNVGAGLPVISVLHELLESGDIIHSIEGIFSGTLGYLFNNYTGELRFSELVRQAQEQGYTEPDPREDLFGDDVARKLLILAREIGMNVNIEDIEVENIVPIDLRSGALESDFYTRLQVIDGAIKKRFLEAKKNGQVLRYIAKLSETKIQACIQSIDKTNPMALTKGADNIIVFNTEHYKQTPLIIRGPGAGAQVTAMGVFGDLMKLYNYTNKY